MPHFRYAVHLRGADLHFDRVPFGSNSVVCSQLGSR